MNIRIVLMAASSAALALSSASTCARAQEAKATSDEKHLHVSDVRLLDKPGLPITVTGTLAVAGRSADGRNLTRSGEVTQARDSSGRVYWLVSWNKSDDGQPSQDEIRTYDVNSASQMFCFLEVRHCYTTTYARQSELHFDTPKRSNLALKPWQEFSRRRRSGSDSDHMRPHEWIGFQFRYLDQYRFTDGIERD